MRIAANQIQVIMLTTATVTKSAKATEGLRRGISTSSDGVLFTGGSSEEVCASISVVTMVN
jgi:hypothetical protein